jgi:hypothetical protein
MLRRVDELDSFYQSSTSTSKIRIMSKYKRRGKGRSYGGWPIDGMGFMSIYASENCGVYDTVNPRDTGNNPCYVDGFETFVAPHHDKRMHGNGLRAMDTFILRAKECSVINVRVCCRPH